MLLYKRIVMVAFWFNFTLQAASAIPVRMTADKQVLCIPPLAEPSPILSARLVQCSTGAKTALDSTAQVSDAQKKGFLCGTSLFMGLVYYYLLKGNPAIFKKFIIK